MKSLLRGMIVLVAFVALGQVVVNYRSDSQAKESGVSKGGGGKAKGEPGI